MDFHFEAQCAPESAGQHHGNGSKSKAPPPPDFIGASEPMQKLQATIQAMSRRVCNVVMLSSRLGCSLAEPTRSQYFYLRVLPRRVLGNHAVKGHNFLCSPP